MTIKSKNKLFNYIKKEKNIIVFQRKTENKIE